MKVSTYINIIASQTHTHMKWKMGKLHKVNKRVMAPQCGNSGCLPLRADP